MSRCTPDQLVLDVSELKERDRSAVRLATLIALTLAVSGAIAIPSVARFGLRSYSLFYEQFAKIEPPALAIVALFAIVTLVLVARAPAIDAVPSSKISAPRATVLPNGMWVALAVLIVTLVGTDLIFHRFFLADDEYSAYFQALIFARGRWNAVVSPEWCRWIGYLTPNTIARPQACTWHVGFLPVHSMVRAVFIALHADRFAGPVMAAISVLLVGAVARRLWPDKPHRMWIAMAVLAVSTQFLVMSMTMYAMPTHLMFAMIWLWLYVVDRRWSIVLLPLVGVIALGVHSPIPHGLLVPFFWLRYVRQKRYPTALYVAAVYAVGIVYWHAQLTGLAAGGASVATESSAAANTIVTMFHLPSPLNLYTSAMNGALIATWNSPVALISALAAGLAWHRLDTFSRDAALTLLFVIVARLLSNSLQGEGWGYRFIYAGLGLFALLAACGCDVLARVLGDRRAHMLLAASLIVSVAIELPMRGIQVEGVIRPYYRAYNLLVRQTATVVVFPSDDFMWARQLVRNDPFLRRKPLIMSMHVPGDQVMPALCSPRERSGSTGPTLATAQAINHERFCNGVRASLAAQEAPVLELERLYPGRVRIITASELASLGLPRQSFRGISVDLAKSGTIGMPTP